MPKTTLTARAEELRLAARELVNAGLTMRAVGAAD